MNLIEFLGIETVKQTAEQVVLRLPVTDQLKQPFGLVHGGINAVLAETAASLGANESARAWHKIAVGVDLEVHHLRAVQAGVLEATATPIHAGKTVQAWQVELTETTKQVVTASATVTLLLQKQARV
ncbi:PaaI family thioesterase [Loigolactobacillus backii]|uniref:Aromatic compound catabolic protein n=1 Tax=Loigolactobacillus backii TaxID=375175 RepID=A0A192H136_9LACO|nr:PaaI family thioesterase [Loigolactobacillus backii]ANK62070.1 aromatic compound catabolic protein [Loigolactobacillus backii]ANK68736.1 aromatic compound catabolic protein [Loigolactobacillus backii]MDA5386740.1 PaaI family thioesterase [Loigolactobacillus backii]MDA5389265.1 PaaI family thioesterase [Loigolactobacillus backii]